MHHWPPGSCVGSGIEDETETRLSSFSWRLVRDFFKGIKSCEASAIKPLLSCFCGLLATSCPQGGMCSCWGRTCRSRNLEGAVDLTMVNFSFSFLALAIDVLRREVSEGSGGVTVHNKIGKSVKIKTLAWDSLNMTRNNENKENRNSSCSMARYSPWQWSSKVDQSRT